MILLEVAQDADTAEVVQRIEDNYPDELVTIKSVDELSKVDQGVEMMNAMSQTISFLAVVICGLGAMNTTTLSVHERTREIGVLRAVGWTRSRILRMILGESLFLSLSGFAVESFLGIAGVYGITPPFS